MFVFRICIGSALLYFACLAWFAAGWMYWRYEYSVSSLDPGGKGTHIFSCIVRITLKPRTGAEDFVFGHMEFVLAGGYNEKQVR